MVFAVETELESNESRNEHDKSHCGWISGKETFESSVMNLISQLSAFTTQESGLIENPTLLFKTIQLRVYVFVFVGVFLS